MPDDPKHTPLEPSSDKSDQEASDGATLKSDSHPVFGSNVQPQEIYHEKVIGASGPDSSDQAAATDTADSHPVFGSSVQPQDVYDEKIVGTPDPDEAAE